MYLLQPACCDVSDSVEDLSIPDAADTIRDECRTVVLKPDTVLKNGALFGVKNVVCLLLIPQRTSEGTNERTNNEQGNEQARERKNNEQGKERAR